MGRYESIQTMENCCRFVKSTMRKCDVFVKELTCPRSSPSHVPLIRSGEIEEWWIGRGRLVRHRAFKRRLVMSQVKNGTNHDQCVDEIGERTSYEHD